MHVDVGRREGLRYRPRKADRMSQEQVYIPPAYLELEVECCECPFESTPDVVVGHLIEKHSYSLRQVKDWVQDFIDSFDADSDGHPLYPEPCPDHGRIRVGEPCYGCQAVDDAIDRAKENRGYNRI
jgi:hypothetical protein